MPRRTHARLRRLLCLASRNARNWSCFFNGIRDTCSKWSCKLQCGCMVFSATTERTLAGFFANASACGTGKRALLAAHHSIPVGHFFAFLSSLAACYKLVLLAHVAAWLAARAPARLPNARRALELARAARHLAASSSSRGASAARLPAVSPRRSIYLPPPPHRTDPITAVTPWRPRLRLRACNACACPPCTGWLHPRLPASG